MIYKLFLTLSWVYILFGLIGIFRFKDMYARLLTGNKIDTVATLTILIAMVIKVGFSNMTLRLLLIIAIVMITNPVSSHIISRSAYKNGIKINHGVE